MFVRYGFPKELQARVKAQTNVYCKPVSVTPATSSFGEVKGPHLPTKSAMKRGTAGPQHSVHSD